MSWTQDVGPEIAADIAEAMLNGIFLSPPQVIGTT